MSALGSQGLPALQEVVQRQETSCIFSDCIVTITGSKSFTLQEGIAAKSPSATDDSLPVVHSYTNHAFSRAGACDANTFLNCLMEQCMLRRSMMVLNQIRWSKVSVLHAIPSCASKSAGV